MTKLYKKIEQMYLLLKTHLVGLTNRVKTALSREEAIRRVSDSDYKSRKLKKSPLEYLLDDRGKR